MGIQGEIEILAEQLAAAEAEAARLLAEHASCQLNTPGRCRAEWKRYERAAKRVRSIRHSMAIMGRRR